MTWPEIKAALDAGYRTIVAAAGSTEQHGPHLPLQTDTLLGTFLVEAIVARLPGVFQGPTIPFGVSEHHMPFAGTITLDTPIFKEVVRQYVASLAAHGFEHIVIIPSHGGNFAPLRELEAETGGWIGGARFIAYTDIHGFIGVMYEVAAQDGITPQVAGAHAGESETSLVLAARADLVAMEYAVEGFVGEFDDAAMAAVFDRGMIALTDNGVLGDARPATAERGLRYRDAMADALAAWIRERLP
jgi:creatinine amidohydrolase